MDLTLTCILLARAKHWRIRWQIVLRLTIEKWMTIKRKNINNPFFVLKGPVIQCRNSIKLNLFVKAKKLWWPVKYQRMLASFKSTFKCFKIFRIIDPLHLLPITNVKITFVCKSRNIPPMLITLRYFRKSCSLQLPETAEVSWISES